MTTQTYTAKEIVLAVIEGTETVLDMQGVAAAKDFINSEMFTTLGMVFEGEMEFDEAHKAYGILRGIKTSYTNEAVWRRNLRHAKEEALKL